MIEELAARYDCWLLDMRERDPLGLFLFSGVVTIILLLMLGFMVSTLFFDVLIAWLILTNFGTFQNGDALFVIAVIKQIVIVIAVSIIMFCFLVDLEEAWRRLISA